MTNIYARDVSQIKTLDPYRLQELYQMHPCAEHVVKKLLVAGEREGGKNLDTDISDCIRTLQRWQAMREEDRPKSETLFNYRWEEKPEEFQWAAMDASGKVHYYKDEPFIADERSVGWTGCGICGGTVMGMGAYWRSSLERRPGASLKPKTMYDWPRVHEKYRWLATDEDGDVFAYEVMPRISGALNGWNYDGVVGFKQHLRTRLEAPSVDWRNSLEERP